MIKLVVFDWNGTLLADTLACMDADNCVLNTFGGKQVDLRTYRETIIIPAIDFYVEHGCKREQLQKGSEKLGKVFHTFYEPRVVKARTRKNAHKLLKWLKDHNIDSTILSNHTVEGISFQLKRLQIEKYIKELLANTILDSSMKKRNKTEKLLQYFEKSNLKSSEVVIIGDSPEEIEMGKSISITTVAITNGYYSKRRLVLSNPDYVIDNLNELITIIKSKNY